LGEREVKRFKVAMPSEIEIEGVRGKQELERECDVEDDRERLKRGRRAFEQERGVEARERERC